MRKISHAFKRGFDVSASLAGLLIFSPLLTLFALLIWFQDFKSPFYISNRVGKNEKIFKISPNTKNIKLPMRKFDIRIARHTQKTIKDIKIMLNIDIPTIP
jgi:hypothetical protein